MSLSRLNPKTIKTRILYALMGTALLSLIGFGVVSFWGMITIAKSSIRGTSGLSNDLLKISKGTLESLTQEGLLKSTVDQAALIDAQFRDVENDLIILVDTAQRIWKNPSAYPRKHSHSKTDPPSDPKSASVWQIPSSVIPASVAQELQISSSMDDLMTSVLKSNPNINDCNIATPRGLFRRFPWSANIDTSYDVRSRDWFLRALKTGSLGWSDPYVGVIARNLRVNCSAPVLNNKKIVAVIGLNVPLTTIQDRIIKMRINGQGKAYLVSKDRRIIAREGLVTDSNNWKDKQTGEFFSFDDEKALPLLDQSLVSGTPGIIRGVLNKQDSFVAYAPISTTGWSVLFALPVEAVYAPIRPTEIALTTHAEEVSSQVYRHIAITLSIMVLVFLAMLLMVTIISRRTARQITAPILELEEGARVIGNGNLEYRLKLYSGDEIQQLAETFNSMAVDLSRYIHDLTETTASKEKIQSELRLATDIQESLLPRIFPPFPERSEFDLYALMNPAKEVGGDFYDFFFVDETHLCLVIGDVSDKGVPAALYMMVAKTLIKSEVMREADPSNVLERVNSILALDNKTSMFVTVFCSILNTDTGEMVCANAGHLPPIIQKTDGTVIQHPFTPGFVLGPMPDITYKKESIYLEPGELFLIYTDGVNEAINPELEEFGEARLINCVNRSISGTAEDIIHSVRDEVHSFSNGAPQSDDITMLAIRYLGKKL